MMISHQSHMPTRYQLLVMYFEYAINVLLLWTGISDKF